MLPCNTSYKHHRFADMEEGEVAESMVTGRFSSDEAEESGDDWSGGESASVIAERIRQQRRDTRIPRIINSGNLG
jgi:hypothetical protein